MGKVKELLFEDDALLICLAADGYKEEIDKATTAATMGCEARYPSPYEVMCDLDTPEAVVTFNERFAFLREAVTGMFFRADFLKSRNGNCHVVVTCSEEITQEMRLMLQAMLGSDPKREILGFMRYLKHGEANDCLFRPL